MLRESFWNQQFVSTIVCPGDSGASLPRRVRLDDSVAFDPIESALASYITRQVASVIAEIQETPLRPFVEGEPIGTIAPAAVPTPVHGIPQADFNRMSAEVWTAHNAKRGGLNRHYVAYPDLKYRFTWVPANKSFRVEKLS